jgi:hypothetical protein
LRNNPEKSASTAQPRTPCAIGCRFVSMYFRFPLLSEARNSGRLVCITDDGCGPAGREGCKFAEGLWPKDGLANWPARLWAIRRANYLPKLRSALNRARRRRLRENRPGQSGAWLSDS